MLKKVATIIGFSALVLLVQGATLISGTVINTMTNQPISGARVLIGEVGLVDSTDAQGAFSFSDGITSIAQSDSYRNTPAGANSPLLSSGEIAFKVKTASPVSLVVRSLNGRTVFQFGKKYQPGTYALSQPSRAAGIYFCELTIGTDRYTLKQVSFGPGSGSVYSSTRGGISSVGKRVSDVAAAGAYSNTILVSRKGFLSEAVPCRLLSALTGLVIKLQPDSVPDVQPNPDTLPGISTKPVKVYIMMGQSNMVGMGMVSRNGAGWFPANFFQKDKPDTSRGGTVSFYSGAYSATANYDAMAPTAVKTLKVIGGATPDTFPNAGVKVVRGFCEFDSSHILQFTVGWGESQNSVMTINGVEVYRKNVGQTTPTLTSIQVTAHTRYPFSITFMTSANSAFGWMTIMDVRGSLSTVVKIDKKFPWLLDPQGNWAVRRDVWYKGVRSATADKWLSTGCGAGSGSLGPELGFGTVMGNYHAEPVLLLKASIGNRGLGWDYLPPKSTRWLYNQHTWYCGSGDSAEHWPDTIPYAQVPKVKWYAGMEYDLCTKLAHDVLDSFGIKFPQWKDQGYEIAGFVWFQGNRDGFDAGHAYRYEFNLVNFIKAIRAEFHAPANAPFVLGTGCGFDWNANSIQKQVMEAQLAVSGEKGKYPEFVGNVRTMETRDFCRDKSISPTDEVYHYCENGESYYLIGDALGRAMVSLLKK